MPTHSLTAAIPATHSHVGSNSHVPAPNAQMRLFLGKCVLTFRVSAPARAPWRALHPEQGNKEERVFLRGNTEAEEEKEER